MSTVTMSFGGKANFVFSHQSPKVSASILPLLPQFYQSKIYLSKINILTIHSIQFMVQHDFGKKFKWSYKEFRGLQMAIKQNQSNDILQHSQNRPTGQSRS